MWSQRSIHGWFQLYVLRDFLFKGLELRFEEYQTGRRLQRRRMIRGKGWMCQSWDKRFRYQESLRRTLETRSSCTQGLSAVICAYTYTVHQLCLETSVFFTAFFPGIFQSFFSQSACFYLWCFWHFWCFLPIGHRPFSSCFKKHIGTYLLILM